MKNKREDNDNLRKSKTEEDYRYDNFLNENSINFPKQLLELCNDSKQYDSHRDDKEQKDIYKDENNKKNQHLS